MNLKFNLRKIVKLGTNMTACLFAGFISLSAAPSLAATVTYSPLFTTGWNLAGNSLTTAINVKTTIGSQAGVQSVWKWDAAGSKWAFYSPSLDTAGTLTSYAASKGYSVLATINQGEGYWVNASAQVSLAQANGTGFSLAASNLVTGWNLTATGDNIAPTAFTTNVGNVTTLWAWDNANSAWYFYAPALVANNTLASYISSKSYKDFGAVTLGNGRGFWVNYAGAAAGGGTGGTTPTMLVGTWKLMAYKVNAAASVTDMSPYNMILVLAANGDWIFTQPSTVGTCQQSGTSISTSTTFTFTTVSDPCSATSTAGKIEASTYTIAGATLTSDNGTATYTYQNQAVAGPSAPTVPTATAASATQINLSWTAVTGATGYNVYRATATGVVVGTGSKITASPLTAASFNDTGLTAATAYYYKVTAVNATGESVASAEMSAATSAAGGTTPTITGLMGGSIQTAPLGLTVANVTAFAGSSASGAIDGTGTAATFTIPGAITTDGQYLFVADESAHVIRKVVIATGAVTTLAGSSVSGSADGQGANASFNKPTGITTDGSNLYVSDASNNNIRKIVIATGVVTTLAGSGVAGAADGTGTAASFKAPYGITTDGANLYVVDYMSGNIRKIVIASGAVTTLAGSGTGGFANGNGAAASFKQPNGITTDGTNLYVADYGNYQIRKIVIATREVSTVAGSQAFGSTDGVGANASFYLPWGITTDGTNLYVTDSANRNIRKIVLATGAVTTLAGSGVNDSVDGTGTAAAFVTPYGITTDGKDIYVTEPLKIRKISAAALTAPTGVNVTASSISQINVNWTNVTGATAYNIYRSTTPNVKVNAYNKITIGTTPTAGPFVDGWLATGTTYYYKVTAITATGESVASTEVSATTLGPTAPTGVTATAASASQINLSWMAVTGATGYNVYRGTGSWFVVDAASRITANPLTTASFNDTGLTAATTYYYKVTTVDANGESVASTAASAATQPPPLIAPTVTPGTKLGGAVMGPLTLSGTVTPVTLSPALTMPPLTAALTTDGTSLYAYGYTSANGYGVYKINKATGATSLLAATSGTVSALTSDGIDVFVTASASVGGVVAGGIYRIAPDGTATSLLSSASLGYTLPTGLAVVGNNLYFAMGGSAYIAGQREITKIDLTTKVISTLTFGRNSCSGYMVCDGVGTNTASGTGATFNWLGAMTTDGTYLYVLEAANANPGIVRQISLADGSVKTLGGITRLLWANYASWMMGTGITTDGAGNVYVVNQASSQIIKYDIATNVASVVATGSAAGTNCASNKAPPTCTGFHGGVTSDGTNLYAIDGNKLVKIQQTGVTILPAAPSGLTATAVSDTQISLSWSAVSGAIGYNVYRATAAGVAISAQNKIATTADVTTAYADAGLTAATPYYYIVTAVNAGTVANPGGEGVASSEVTTTTQAVIPVGPIGTQMGGARQGAIPTSANVVTTFAGSTYGAADGTGTAAQFSYPQDITTDGTNLYVVDTNAHTIRKIVIATGAVTTLAGSGSAGAVNGTSTAASFNYPQGITTNGTYLFVADTNNNTIRKIEITTGAVTTLAGSGAAGSADGAATVASFNSPKGITTDGTNLYVADTGSQKIRQIVIATGVVTTLAGSGVRGFADGTGTAAKFTDPSGITTDGTNLYVADTFSSRVRQIVIATKAVTSLAYLNRPRGISTDGTNLYVADSGDHVIRKIEIATGTLTTLAGSSGVFGMLDGTGTAAKFNQPGGIVSDGISLYVVDYVNQKIRKIGAAPYTPVQVPVPAAPNGVTAAAISSSQIALNWPAVTGALGYYVYRASAPNLPLTSMINVSLGSASMGPSTLATSLNDNNLNAGTAYYYKVVALNANGSSAASFEVSATTGTNGAVTTPAPVTGLLGGTILGTPLNLTKAVTTFAGSGTAGAVDATKTAASFKSPVGITTDGTNLYLADSGSNKIRQIVISSGVVTTLAGSGATGAVDALSTAASFNSPLRITTDGINLYVTDMNKIRKIVISSGAVSTLAGSGLDGAADGTSATASFSSPAGITTDGTNLYVADQNNHKIRKVVIATGAVTTLAGSGLSGNVVDGMGAAATFNAPLGITTDGINLYVADTGVNKIRQIVIATGAVTTLAGSGAVGATDGTGTAASFNYPGDISTDGTNLYVTSGSKVRQVVIATKVVTTLAGSGTVGAADGTGTAATFNQAIGITTDGTSLYVADTVNNKIRKIQ